MAHRFADVDEVTQRLAKASYLATPMIANVAFLADRLEKPILAEGPDQSVEKPPGSMRVTWTPKSATSWARDWLKASSAHLDAW